MKYRIRVGQKEHAVTLLARTESAMSFEVGGTTYDISVKREADEVKRFETQPLSAGSGRTPSGAHRGDPGEIKAPMPGVVVEICCKVGARIEQGDPVIVIEAMKMENCITAGRGGVVKDILTTTGKQVAGGELLVIIG